MVTPYGYFGMFLVFKQFILVLSVISIVINQTIDMYLTAV
jgi:hypothetical protein